MKYTITREFFETYEIEADTLDDAIQIMDDCKAEPVEVTYGDITYIHEEF